MGSLPEFVWSPARLFVGDDEGVDAERRGQLGVVVQFDERFEYFRIDALGWFFRTDVLFAEHLADPHHPAPKFLIAISLRGHIRTLANPDLSNIRLVNINTHAQA